MIRGQFAPHEKGQRDRADDRDAENKIRAEPIVLLTFFEHRLETAQAAGEKSNACPIDLAAPQDLVFIEWEKNQRRDDRENSDRQVDEENPPPAPRIGEVAAEDRTDGRSSDNTNTEHGLSGALFFRRK